MWVYAAISCVSISPEAAIEQEYCKPAHWNKEGGFLVLALIFVTGLMMSRFGQLKEQKTLQFEKVNSFLPVQISEHFCHRLSANVRERTSQYFVTPSQLQVVEKQQH